MGNFIGKSSKIVSVRASKKSAISSNKIIHRAKVLSSSDVEANRCMAYAYLSL